MKTGLREMAGYGAALALLVLVVALSSVATSPLPLELMRRSGPGGAVGRATPFFRYHWPSRSHPRLSSLISLACLRRVCGTQRGSEGQANKLGSAGTSDNSGLWEE